MTFLRRMAQLVSDLREFNVIVEGDKIAYFRMVNGNFVFGVTLCNFSQRSSDVQAIKDAVVEEFQKGVIDIDLDLREGKIIYKINPQKS